METRRPELQRNNNNHPIDKEGFNLDGMGFLPSFPALNGADDDEFSWTLTVFCVPIASAVRGAYMIM